MIADQDVWWAAAIATIVVLRHTGNIWRRIKTC